MSTGKSLAALIVVVLAAHAAAEPPSTLGALEGEVRALTMRVTPAVVRVEADARRVLEIGGARRLWAVDPSFTESRIGSGFVVGPGRNILTSHSLVAGAVKVRVTFRDGRKTEAKVTGSDSFFRVAVLEAPVPKEIESLQLASVAPKPGSFSLLYGNAHGAGPSMVFGLVCDVRRRHFGFDNFLVVSAPLTPGDSGAPFVGSDGKVQGMGSVALVESSRRSFRAPPSFTASGVDAGRMACCVPAADLRRAMEDITEHGRVRQAWLGVTLAEADPEIRVVVADSPAARAGLRSGDRIVALGQRPVASRIDVAGSLARLRPETTVRIRVRREDGERDLEVKLTTRPASESGDLIPVGGGVQVLHVLRSTGAAELGLQAGDVITLLEGKPVTAVAPVREALNQFPDTRRIDLVVQREGRIIHLAYR